MHNHATADEMCTRKNRVSQLMPTHKKKSSLMSFFPFTFILIFFFHINIFRLESRFLLPASRFFFRPAESSVNEMQKNEKKSLLQFFSPWVMVFFLRVQLDFSTLSESNIWSAKNLQRYLGQIINSMNSATTTTVDAWLITTGWESCYCALHFCPVSVATVRELRIQWAPVERDRKTSRNVVCLYLCQKS